jgi:MerR family mercuric resistance operon transcriptional regulator
MRAITPSRAENLSIGELSKHSGVNIETIRYYERIHMLPAPSRARRFRSKFVFPVSSPFGQRTASLWTGRSSDIGFHPAIPRPRVHA